MIILTLRTDRPQAEVELYEGRNRLASLAWTAHRQLAETIHQQLEEVLKQANTPWEQVDGIVVYKGPGSFTGLRIGASVANAIAYAQHIPIVSRAGKDWIDAGIRDLQAGQSDKVAIPEYGAPAATTTPKK